MRHKDIVGHYELPERGFDHHPPSVAGGKTFRTQQEPRQLSLAPSESRRREEARVRAMYAQCSLPCAEPITEPLTAEDRITLYAERYAAGLQAAFHPDDCRVIAQPVAARSELRDEDWEDDDEEA